MREASVEATDAWGNRRTSTYQVTGGSGATYAYDANGNLIKRTAGTQVWTYGWNALSQLTRVCNNIANPTILEPAQCVDAVAVATFAYDPLGRRVRKTAGGREVRYAYDGQDILREAISEGASTTTYQYLHGPGIDEPLARQNVTPGATGDTWEYFHADGLGSILATTNSSGAVTQSFNYSAWGEIECPAAAPSCAQEGGYRFTGREWDPETGLYYYRARYYDAKAGRFVSEDPLGVMAGINHYGYVQGSPTNYVDSSGATLRTTAQGTVNALAGNAASQFAIRNGVLDVTQVSASDLAGNQGALLLYRLAMSSKVYSYTVAGHEKTRLSDRPTRDAGGAWTLAAKVAGSA